MRSVRPAVLGFEPGIDAPEPPGTAGGSAGALGTLINGHPYRRASGLRGNETFFTRLEEARPHALEVAQEADAPPHEGPEDAKAVSGSPGRGPNPFLPYQVARSSARAFLVAFFHSR